MGFNRAADYKLYGKYLTTGLEKHKASVFKIFRVWNDIFFPGESNVLARAENNGGSTVGTMDLLNADAEEDQRTVVRTGGNMLTSCINLPTCTGFIPTRAM
jgi:hypothetical protein